MLPINLTKIVEYLIRNYPNKFNVNQIARSLKFVEAARVVLEEIKI